MREAYNECVPLLTAYSSELGQNAALYAGYARVLRERGQPPRCRRSASLLENALRDFRLAGVDLPADRKRRATARWCSGSRSWRPSSRRTCSTPPAPTRAASRDESGARRPARQRGRSRGRGCARGEPVGLAVQARSADLHDGHDQRREPRSCGATSTRPGSRAPRSSGRAPADSTTIPIIDEILPLRHELAQLLGFANSPTTRWPRAWRRAASRCSASSRIWRGAAAPRRGREFSDLEEFAGRKLEAWDLAYFSERLQESRFKVSQEALRPYFPLPKVLSGLFAVTERLYGIARARAARGERLAPERALLRSHGRRRDAIVAGFYLDPYSRAEKRSGAWMDECVVAKSLPSGKALPGRAAGLQFHRAGRRRAVAADARRGDDAVPRVRPRPASHAHAGRLSQHRRASTASRGTRWSCRASSWRTSSGAPRCCR